MILKKIHYCWFGGSPLPDLALRCMESWKKYCPDYQIIRWDENNTDLNSCAFVREAYSAKKWAFVSDYIRLKVIEEHGGIYLDIDVELLKPLDPLLGHQGFMGFEQAKPYYVNTGLGFGAIPYHPVIKKLVAYYENIPFIRPDGSLDTTPCPERDFRVLQSFGLRPNGECQIIAGIVIHSPDFFSPISLIGDENFTENTISIHHFNASWHTEEQKSRLKVKTRLINKFGYFPGKVLYYFYLLKNIGILEFTKKVSFKLINRINFK
ncbi:glycosyl transferase [Vibrio anguillarum]|uniref:Glycosyl transferase n=2 Tax=Vibrio anguillarum TaxID=55601 RepID=A0ABD4QU70_VIBAN|nr:glycosyl transferase [Vibrio anguillarum]